MPVIVPEVQLRTSYVTLISWWESTLGLTSNESILFTVIIGSESEISINSITGANRRSSQTISTVAVSVIPTSAHMRTTWSQVGSKRDTLDGVMAATFSSTLITWLKRNYIIWSFLTITVIAIIQKLLLITLKAILLSLKSKILRFCQFLIQFNITLFLSKINI